MSVLAYRLRRYLTRRRPDELALTAVVAAVGAAVLFLAAGAVRTAGAADRHEAWRGDPVDTLVEQPAGPPRTAELAALSAVETVDTATFVFGGLTRSDGQPADSLVFSGSQEAFGAYLVEGRDPDPSSPGEFVVSQSFVDATGARPGDRFQLVTLTAEQARELGFDAPSPGGPTMTATLVGVFSGAADLQDEFALALFPPTLLDQGDIGISASQHAVRLAPGATMDELRGQLDASPDGRSLGISGAAPWVPEPVRDAAETRARGVTVVAAIGALAAVVVLGQLLTRQVRLADAEVTPLRAMGMTSNQLVADSLSRITVPVVVGSIVAGLAALAASGWFPLGFVADIEPDPGLRFELPVHLLGPAVLIVAVHGRVLAGLVRGRRGLRRPSTAPLVDGLASKVRPAQAATGVRFALTRQSTDNGTVGAPLLGLTTVLAVLVAALTFGFSLGRLFDEPWRYGGIALGLGQGGSEEIRPEIISILESDPDVGGLTLTRTEVVSVGSTALDITGILPVRGSVTPPVLAGRLPVGDDEIALGKVSARDLGVEVGGELAVVGPAGPRSLIVSGIALIPSIEGGDGVGVGGVATFAGLRRLSPEAVPTTAMLVLRPGSAAGSAERLSEAVGMAIGPPSQPIEIINLGRVRSIPYVVAATLGALTVLNLAHQLIVSARWRRRDVAVLQALGADRRWVTGVVHWQATVFALIGVPLALPVGTLVGSVTFRAFIDRIGAQNTPSIPLVPSVALIVALVVLANLVGLLPARRARNARPARQLAAE